MMKKRPAEQRRAFHFTDMTKAAWKKILSASAPVFDQSRIGTVVTLFSLGRKETSGELSPLPVKNYTGAAIPLPVTRIGTGTFGRISLATHHQTSLYSV